MWPPRPPVPRVEVRTGRGEGAGRRRWRVRVEVEWRVEVGEELGARGRRHCVVERDSGGVWFVDFSLKLKSKLGFWIQNNPSKLWYKKG